MLGEVLENIATLMTAEVAYEIEEKELKIFSIETSLENMR